MMIVQNLSWRIRTLAQLNTNFPLHVYCGPRFLIIGHLCCLSLPNFDNFVVVQLLNIQQSILKYTRMFSQVYCSTGGEEAPLGWGVEN